MNGHPWLTPLLGSDGFIRYKGWHCHLPAISYRSYRCRNGYRRWNFFNPCKTAAETTSLPDTGLEAVLPGGP
jgi:hypothetical protein